MTADAAKREYGEQARLRVLLADDNADLREHVRRLLADSYHVEGVANGAGALAAARERKPDLVVANVLPVVDGFELIRELRADAALRDVPIIALSARASEDVRSEGLSRGADDYVTTPFSGGELLVRVEALLRSARVRKGIEAELRESEQRLRLALEAGRMGSWEWHIPSNRVVWSADLEAIHGLARGAFLGTFEAFQRDMHPDDRDRVLRCVGQTLGGRDHHIEYRIVRPDGSVRWVEGRGKLFRDEHGSPLRVVGVCGDITERKRADEAQRLSEQRYRTVLSLMPAAVYTCDAPSGVISYYNEHAAALWGRAPRPGDTDERFCGSYRLWLPDGSPLPHDQTPMAMAMRENREFRNREVVVERPDGSRVTVLVNIDPLRDAAGLVTGAINVFHDVSERRQQEERLRESERRLAAETEALAKLNVASSRLWRAKTLSDGLEVMLSATIELLGADRGNVQLLDGSVLRIAAQRGFREDFLEFFREVSTEDDSACGRALRSGERIVIDDVEADLPFEPLRPIARAAGYRAVQSTPLLARDGRPLGMISTHWAHTRRQDEQGLRRLDLYARQAADFIERCQADERLRRSEQALNDFFETAAVGLHSVGPDGIILRANQAELQLLGYTQDEYVGRHLAEFHVDRAVIDDILARLTRGERLHEYPSRMRCKDGSVRDVLVTSSVLFDNGRFMHTRCFTVDITASKRAEAGLLARARQQQAVASLGELALRERDVQKVFERATAAVADTLDVEYCKVLELVPGGREVLLRAGVGWKEGLVGSARVGTGADSQAGFTLASGAPVIVRDLRTEPRFRDPTLLTEHGVVSGMSCIIRGGEGEAWGVLGTHATRLIEFTDDDVSFLTAVANVLGYAIQRDGAEAALRESDRRKDEFIAMLSHELRNPLAPLRSALEVLRLRSAGDEDVRTMMERQVSHLVRLVDDLLETSRISRGLLELRREPVQVTDALRSAVESAEPLVREFGHRLELDLPSEPLWLRGDPVRLVQTFANLLNNAARYTPPGGKIWLRATREHKSEVCVSVRDSGLGFTLEAKARLFEMFSRGEGSSGLGIGLALVRKLVEMHGGSVEAHSEGEGRGAEFLVRLPLDRAPASADAKTVHGDGSTYRVLVADDNRDAAESLAMLLRALGNEVSVASDGIEAVQAMHNFRPHIVLLDIGMPRLDGYGAAREIRRHPLGRDIRLVALTGWGQEEDRRRAREAGFDAHLVKPAELDALRRVLADVKPEALH